jgi:hypothetical protein
MTDECFRLEELESLIDLDAQDPRRRHLEDCPLCRARLAAYKAFITEGPPQAGSKPERAEAELGSFMENMIRGSEARSDSRARLHARRFPKRVLIPGLAVAAAAAVILIIALSPFPGGDRQLPAPLRGSDSPSITGAGVSVRPVEQSGSSVLFSWTARPDADRYEIQIFNARLEGVARFEAGGDTSLTVESGDLPGPDEPFFWRIAAFRGGDEIAHSRPLPLDRDTR